MNFRTPVHIDPFPFRIAPQEELLCVGSCFADSIGRRFREELFPATVNPFGVMYNPVSILHTVERCTVAPGVALLTLGTNHVYRLKSTGEIVDNCQKRPQSLFDEQQLTVGECCEALSRAVSVLQARSPGVRVVLTVSPIRYAKYGFHGSQLSKATLLLAADRLAGQSPCCTYFPAYEIVNDELRDYRFYAPDMLHPTQQAVDYIWERLVEVAFSDEARRFLADWAPVKAALNHRPFNPDSDGYRAFMAKTMLKVAALSEKYPKFATVYRTLKNGG